MRADTENSIDQRIGYDSIIAAAAAVLGMSLSAGSIAEVVQQSLAVPEATLAMCATRVFRDKNLDACVSLERKATATPSTKASVPPAGSVPSTSPNYGKSVKPQ